MKRIVTLGLMASTLLSVAMPAAAQREGRGRAEGSEGARPQRGPDGGGGQRNWSRPAPQQNPQQNAAPSPGFRAERPASAVGTTAVPPSAPNPAQWRQQRDAVPRPGTPGAGNYRNPGAAPQVAAPVQQQPRRDWTRDDNRPGVPNGPRPNAPGNGNWNRGDAGRPGYAAAPDRNWRDRNGDRDAARNDWSRQRESYQRRLNDRDRWADTRRWDNNAWRNDRRYDWQGYRVQNRGLFHLPAYYAPYGWSYGYRRFSIGIYLSNVLFASDYWLDDPYEYRLPPAYGPMRWIRYYDDALLVDIRDGYVVDVIHDFFW